MERETGLEPATSSLGSHTYVESKSLVRFCCEPATSSLGSHTYVESKSLVRFCCELLNLQHLAKSAIFESVPANEAQTRQVLHSIITPMVATGAGPSQARFTPLPSMSIELHPVRSLHI